MESSSFFFFPNFFLADSAAAAADMVGADGGEVEMLIFEKSSSSFLFLAGPPLFALEPLPDSLLDDEIFELPEDFFSNAFSSEVEGAFAD